MPFILNDYLIPNKIINLDNNIAGITSHARDILKQIKSINI